MQETCSSYFSGTAILVISVYQTQYLTGDLGQPLSWQAGPTILQKKEPDCILL
jgi:hypothetical protein